MSIRERDSHEIPRRLGSRRGAARRARVVSGAPRPERNDKSFDCRTSIIVRQPRSLIAERERRRGTRARALSNDDYHARVIAARPACDPRRPFAR